MENERLKQPEHNPVELYEVFAQSEYGQTLESRSRFNDFKPEWVTSDQWSDLLGDDINNLRHMTHTHNLAKQFCSMNSIDDETTKLLLTTAATHDFGEAIIGDIALPSKTADDETNEEVAYRFIAGEIYGDKGDALSDEVWSVLSHKVEAGDMFRAIEYVGYCTSGMRAGHVANLLSHDLIMSEFPRVQKQQLIGGLMAMNKALEVQSYPILKEYVKKYPGIEYMLEVSHGK